MRCRNFPEYTKYQKLIQEGFDLLYPSLYQNFVDIWEYELIGEPQLDLRNLTNNLYYELYRLAEWLIEIDRYLERCQLSCISKEDSDKIKNKFLIQCPLICSNDKSLELIKLFEQAIPLCTKEFYRWVGSSVCFSGDLVYQTLELTQGGVTRLIIVPFGAPLSYYLSLGIPQLEAERLIQERTFQADSSQCCPFDEVNFPFLEIVSVLSTSLSVNYQLNNPEATGLITLGTQSQTLTSPTGTVIFSGLTADTTYQLSLTVSNCAGEQTLTITVSTPPYVVTIVLGSSLVGNLQLLNGLVVGANSFSTYCQQVNIAFQGINNLHKITTFQVDGQNRLSEVVFNQVINGNNIGGTFTIPCIDKDYLIFIDGEPVVNCDDIDLSISGNTITISV